MIAYIEGQVSFLETGYAVIKANGIGYQVLLNKKDIEHLSQGQDISLFIHTNVREDAIELYGFVTRVHKQVFLLLISVSGVGPKLALSILSAITPSDLVAALVNKDIGLLSSVPGIGKKTAERLTLELKDKALKLDILANEPCEATTRTSLEQAIKGLGYSKLQSDKAMLSLDQEDFLDLPLEALIKKALNVLAGNKP